MEAEPKSIFAKLSMPGILMRLPTITVEADGFGVAIPEGTVRELFKALETKLPEVGPAINEIPSDPLIPATIENVIKAAETAIDAQITFLDGVRRRSAITG